MALVYYKQKGQKYCRLSVIAQLLIKTCGNSLEFPEQIRILPQSILKQQGCSSYWRKRYLFHVKRPRSSHLQMYPESLLHTRER